MPTAIPSLQIEVQNEYQGISEGYFQFDGLEKYLTQHDISHKVVSSAGQYIEI